MGTGASSHNLNGVPQEQPSEPRDSGDVSAKLSSYIGDADMETVGKTLANVLHDDICIEYFAVHLANEHSSENLDFYESVDHFHHEWDLDHKNATDHIAKKIWQLYVASNGPLAVNLPSKIRIASEKCIISNSITRDVFDMASNEIYNVMNRDSFSRFKLSPLWQDYQEHPDRHPDGVPPPAVARLAGCYTGRRNSETLMTRVGKQTIDEVINNALGMETYQNFVKVESPKEGTETLLVYTELQQFDKFLENIGIPTDEDKLDIEAKIKELLEKSKEAKNLPEFITQELLDVPGRMVAGIGIKELCDIFKPVETLSRDFLNSEGTFEKFLNSALYIKYRMHMMKEEQLDASWAKNNAEAIAKQASKLGQ